MATRRETNQQRLHMKRALRSACEQGVLRSGEMAPTLRQLAEEYSVSRQIASQVLQELVNEGLFYTVPRVGTFVGQRTPYSSEYYLYLNTEGTPNQDFSQFINDQMRAGFEERIAIFGGAVMALTPTAFFDWLYQGSLPEIAGVFNLGLGEEAWQQLLLDTNNPKGSQAQKSDALRALNPHMPVVRFGDRLQAEQKYDIVSFDDFQGGFQATEYLQKAGHQRIAFLAMHSRELDSKSHLYWSAERERGWRSAMKSTGFQVDTWAFHPTVEPDPYDSRHEIESAKALSRMLLTNRELTAVVAANDAAAVGLLHALRESQLPDICWPAIVSFDGRVEANNQLLTSAQLPWHQIGSQAADLLWNRSHGLLPLQPQHRRVPMRIITRMTSRSQWSHNIKEVVLTQT